MANFETFKDGGLKYTLLKLKTKLDLLLNGKVDKTKQAEDNELGLIKTNSNQSISLNDNGQLEVGGRMGQFATTTGLFAPNNREPRQVGNYSLLMTDAKGVSMNANRSMAVVSGLGIACKSAVAGTTEYHITNNYNNRILAKIVEGGFASRDETTSTQEQVIEVVN